MTKEKNYIDASFINDYKHYSFDDFIKCDSNNELVNKCIVVAEMQENKCNPLYIYGDRGMGKTHLLFAIGSLAYKNNTKLRILYVTGECFCKEFINSINSDSIECFKNEYNNLDMLLIDNIDDLRGKEQTQKVFLEIFNMLHEQKKQIVVSSRIPMRNMKGYVDDKIRSRCYWGSNYKIELPDYLARVKILKNQEKMNNPKYEIDENVINYIANSDKTNIREMISSLKIVILQTKIRRQKVNLEDAKTMLTLGFKQSKDIENMEFKNLGEEVSFVENDEKFVNSYVVLDLETTGLSPNKNEIIEIAAIKVKNNKVLEVYNKLIKPDNDISEFITSITDISREMIVNAPKINEVIKEFNDFIKDEIIIGYNICFDLNFISDKSVKYLGRDINNKYIDVMKLVKKIFPQIKHYKQTDIASLFNIDTDSAHRALKDCEMCKCIYEKIKIIGLPKEV